MKSFSLNSNPILFSDDFDVLNGFRKSLFQSSIFNEMVTILTDTLGNLQQEDYAEAIANVLPSKFNDCIKSKAVPIAIDFLIDHDIFDCDEATFIGKYQETYFDYAKQPTFQRFLNEFNELIEAYNEHTDIKEYNRANRSQWVGGGFGVQGAIKGAATAAAMNVATDTVRGIGWAISDFADSRKLKKLKKEMLTEELFDEIGNAMIACLSGVYLACLKEYSSHTGETYEWVSEDNIRKSEAIFNNVKTRVSESDRAVKLLSNAIQLSPYNMEYFTYLYGSTDCDRREIIDISNYLGVSLDDYRIEKASNELDALMDEYLPIGGKAYKNHDGFREYADQIIEIGINNGFFTGKKPITISSSEQDLTFACHLIANVEYGLLKSCDRQFSGKIYEIKGEYYEEHHKKALERINEIEAICNISKYEIQSIEDSIKIKESYFNGDDLKKAEEERLSVKETGLIDEVIAIADNSSLSLNEKIFAVSEIAKTNQISFNGSYFYSDCMLETSKAMNSYLAREEIKGHLENSIQNQILKPSIDIFRIDQELRNIFHKYNLLEQTDSEEVRERVVHPNDYADFYYCNDVFAIVTEICRYVRSYRKPVDYEKRQRIGEIIINHCRAALGNKKFFVNTEKDPKFGRSGSVGQLAYSADVPKEDVIYAYYLESSFFKQGLILSDSGIFHYSGSGESFTWTECPEAKSGGIVSKLWIESESKGKPSIFCDFVDDGIEIINDIIYDVSRLADEYTIDEPELVYDKTFLSERLNYYLSPEIKDKILLLGHNDKYEKQKLIKESSIVLMHESEPILNLYIQLGAYDYDTAEDLEKGKYSYLLVTNNFAYISVDGMTAIPVANIEEISAEIYEGAETAKPEATKGKLNITADGFVYGMGVRNFSASELRALADQLNKALAITIESSGSNNSPILITETSSIQKTEPDAPMQSNVQPIEGKKSFSEIMLYIGQNFDSSTKIQAIKYYRENTGADLKSAQDAVEAILKAASNTQNVEAGGPDQNSTQISNDQQSVEEIAAYIKENFDESINLSAYKYYKEKTGVTYQDAKIAVDAIFKSSAEKDIAKPNETNQGDTDATNSYTEQNKAPDTMFCMHCGKKILRTAKFCNYCGSKVTYVP